MFKKLKLGTKVSIIIGVLILVCYLGVFASILVQVKSKSISDSETLAKEVSLSYATQITSNFKQLEIVGKDLRDAVINQKKLGLQNRELVIAMQKEILNTNPRLKKLITQIIQQDPRPRYQEKMKLQESYAFKLEEYDVHFTIAGKTAKVLTLR